LEYLCEVLADWACGFLHMRHSFPDFGSETERNRMEWNGTRTLYVS